MNIGKNNKITRKALGTQSQLIIDLIFVLVLLPLMIYLLPIERWFESNTLFVCLLVGWLYLVYFVNRVFTMPALFRDRKHLIWALLVVVAMIAITYLLTQYKLEFPWRNQRPPGMVEPPRRPMSASRLRLHQQAVWFLFVIVMTFSSAMGLLRELYRQRAHQQELEAAKDKAELSLYKAQIDPHFLFNTLNTLYSMVVTGSPKTEDAFMQFIDITRYIYNNANQDRVDIDSEAQYLQQYIDLQRNRMNAMTTVNFAYENDESVHGATIPPMVLITFVENALKYGVSASEPSVIDVALTVNDGTMTLCTSNPICSKPAEDKPAGIGIENCRRRLDLIYGDNYSLDIDDTDDKFNVLLKINLSMTNNEMRSY